MVAAEFPNSTRYPGLAVAIANAKGRQSSTQRRKDRKGREVGRERMLERDAFCDREDSAQSSAGH
jgi:hypothetical protein